MTQTLPQSPTAPRRASTRSTKARLRARVARPLAALLERPALGRYTDHHGRTRELLAQAGARGSLLVIDRDEATLEDARLLAHLGADEPAENAAIVCAEYLRGAEADRCRCRTLTAADARTAPFVEVHEAGAADAPVASETQPVDERGRRYSLELTDAEMSIPALRWCRTPEAGAGQLEQVSLRDAIAALESYEPTLAITIRALSLHSESTHTSTTILRAELVRVRESPIVLNRLLRDAVLQRVTRGELSMSEIAVRCGRVKRDRKGNESGETSWLARRIGVLAEGGHSAPTPWIHSDVLALIARSGLGISPREVEL
jgi:hypothetical protein